MTTASALRTGPSRTARRRACAVTASVLAVVLAAAPATVTAAAPTEAASTGQLPAATTLPDAVLPRLTPSDSPVSAAAVAQRLTRIKKGPIKDVGAIVLDGAGRIVYESGNTPKVPASTMKLLTSLVALHVLGPETRFETTVAHGPAVNEVTLVGGGDPLLESATTRYPGGASLERLAADTAAALLAKKVRTVALRLDVSLFGGPSWNPEWSGKFKWSVAPITPLKVDHALAMEGSLNRDPSPNDHAGRAFVAALARHGVRVSAVTKGRTPAAASLLARVRSLPVSAIVAETLSTSDNDAAETLLWQAALRRGEPASFASARSVFAAEARALGLFDEGMVLADGSGISPRNRVTPGVLARAVQRGVDSPTMRHLLVGLPVAGATGTLDVRFAATSAAAARGRVRAKTGSVAGVDSLAGYVVSADGHPFTFAFVLNGAPTAAAGRAWIDDAGAALAGCGC